MLSAGPGRGLPSDIAHVRTLPKRSGVTVDWPEWVGDDLRERLAALGISAPWSHQAHAAELARAGEHVIMATGTASGKSLGFLLPSVDAIQSGGTVLYMAPTKALAADQERSLRALGLPDLTVATYDGDTRPADRTWIRRNANLVLTNPDMLHHAFLGRHAAWSGFLRRLRYVVIDESHRYRGVFGSHIAHVIRRLRRVCAGYRSAPTFVLASATSAEPEVSASRLIGLPVTPVATDGAPHGATCVALVEPEPERSPSSRGRGGDGEVIRRSATAEAADVLATLVGQGVQTLAFVRSRQGAEVVSVTARRHLAERHGEPIAERVAAYRAGYLAEDRRRLERDVRSGAVLGLAATNALELGVDIAGVDAVVIAGWPGTLASLWQQAGRAGRSGQDALAVFIARDDPLDTYLVHHPEAVFDRPVESSVLDPDNPHVLGPHLCAAAEEMPLREGDLDLFGPAAPETVEDLSLQGLLRRRPRGWFWTKRERAASLVDLRGAGGPPVQIADAETGQLLGTVDEGAAHASVHSGAVHLHQGATYVVDELDLESGVALVHAADPQYTTWARDVTEIAVLREIRSRAFGPNARLHFGEVEVRRQVVGYLKRDVRTGAVLGEEPLDLPERVLRSKAVWWTLAPEVCERLGAEDVELRGAAHAAEHAAIGLLPLFATCDRWDIGGLSTTGHVDTGTLTVFVYDGYPGGAGFAERGYEAAESWLAATHEAIATCPCANGCPSCIQSPKCGNGNDPLSKSGALSLIAELGV
ncbi:DEAD/DEAH box helicase [Spiractinospora alimapuensis]|nr:DEAD/DEAH box helicase [Spiractinospora alimapuensis]